MIPIGEIESTLDSLTISASADQGHVDQLMVKLYQMTEMNKILIEKINHIMVMDMILTKKS